MLFTVGQWHPWCYFINSVTHTRNTFPHYFNTFCRRKSWHDTGISCSVQGLQVITGVSWAFFLCIAQCNKGKNWPSVSVWGSCEWSTSNSLSNFCIMLLWTPSKQCPVIKEELCPEYVVLCLPSATKWLWSCPWLWRPQWHLGSVINPSGAGLETAKGETEEDK